MNRNYRNTFRKLALASGIAAFALSCSISWAAEKAGAGKTSILDECKRCHDVEAYVSELKASTHAFDKDKKPIQCDQCHTLHYDPITSYYARSEYADKKIFKPEDFNRRSLQENARGAIPPEKCQACHKDLYKNVKGEPISQLGDLCHEAFLGQTGSPHRNCAGCHMNIAHLPEFDKRYTFNADFAKRLAEQEGQKK